MALAPFSHTTMRMPKAMLTEANNTFVGIDRGSTLTKGLYATEDTENADSVVLNFILYVNEDFEHALAWMKKHAVLPKTGEIRLTGVGCDKYLALIEETIGLKPVFISEFMAHNRGAMFLLENFEDEEICYPDYVIEAAAPVEMSKSLQDVIKKQIEDLQMTTSEESRLPVIFGMCGSGIGYMKIEKNNMSMVGSPGIGGRTFMSLNRLLLDTGKYDEIVKLAEKGDRRNVDDQVKDIIADAGDNPGPYGRMPPDLPVWAFGKAIEQDKGLEDFKKEDIAAGLTGLLASLIVTSVSMTRRAAKCEKVYLGGNVVRNPALRKEIAVLESFMAAGMQMKRMKFFNNGHTGAIGAMITSVEKENELLK